MELKDFFIGQRVKQKDPDDGTNCYGHVTKIEGNAVWIKWNDMSEPVKHDDADDIASISHGVPVFRE